MSWLVCCKFSKKCVCDTLLKKQAIFGVVSCFWAPGVFLFNFAKIGYILTSIHVLHAYLSLTFCMA